MKKIPINKNSLKIVSSLSKAPPLHPAPYLTMLCSLKNPSRASSQSSNFLLHKLLKKTFFILVKMFNKKWAEFFLNWPKKISKFG